MKIKYYLIALIIILSSCTKESELQITAPNYDLILDKLNGIQAFNDNYTVHFKDGKVYIRDSNGEKEYIFDEALSIFGAIYKNEGPTEENDKYLIAFPLKGGAQTTSISEKSKDIINDIANIAKNPQIGAKVIENVKKAYQDSGKKIEITSISKGIFKDINIPQDKIEELKAKIETLNEKKDIGTPQIFKNL